MECVKDCPSENFNVAKEANQIVFESSRCILCGHCIAVCPENAIMYEDMKDKVLDFKEGKDPDTLISYNALHQFLRVKRSIRQYEQKKVPQEEIQKVINSMRYAPTGANMRMIKCLIISNDEKRKILSESLIAAHQSGEIRERFKKMKEQGIDPIFYDAPHILIFYSKNQWDFINVAITMTYGMLSAQSLGLGTCWIGFAQGILLENHEIRRKTTGIETYVLGVMTLGYPAVKYHRAPPRPPLEVREIDEL